MLTRVRDSGEGKLGCFIWLAFFAIASLVAYKMIPIRVQAGQLHDFMEEQARFGAKAGTEKVKAAIVRRANDLGLPLKADDIEIEIKRNSVRMEARYVVPVEFPGYTYHWEFKPVIDESRFHF